LPAATKIAYAIRRATPQRTAATIRTNSVMLEMRGGKLPLPRRKE
jgi:hypothetical protein